MVVTRKVTNDRPYNTQHHRQKVPRKIRYEIKKNEKRPKVETISGDKQKAYL